MYKTVCKEDLKQLILFTAAERVLSGDAISADYSHDELGGISHMPEALVRVQSTQEVSAVMRYADAERIPVVVRGSGTGLVGAGVAMYGGIMLETTGMNRILELDSENMTVRVQPGVLLMELAAYCEARGFLYAPDPGEKSATIGGNISTNAGGMRAVKYGTTRDSVRALTAVLPSGEILKLGGKVKKNSTGYALKDLLIGSEGTLAVITEAVLRVVPLPETTVSLLIPFPSIRDAIQNVPLLMQSKIPLTAVEFMERETILFSEQYLGKRFPDTAAPAYLLLTIDGERAAVESALACAAGLCIENGALDAYIVDTEERRASVWTARGAFLEAIKASTTEMDECDVVVPISHVADYVLYTHEVARELGLRIPSFGHAGDGNLHIYICRDALSSAEWETRLKQAFERLYAKADEMQGFVSGEHGIGFAKKRYMAETLGETQLRLMRGIKAVFDPNQILNPGKLF